MTHRFRNYNTYVILGVVIIQIMFIVYFAAQDIDDKNNDVMEFTVKHKTLVG